MTKQATITLKNIAGPYIAVGSMNLAGREFEAVDAFITANAKHFDRLLEMGRHFYVITSDRIPAFTAYAERHGFKVEAA